MSTRAAIVLLAAAVVTVPRPGRGEPLESPEATVERSAPAYETVVVAKRRSENPFLSSRSVSTLSAEQLAERSPRTMPEALWDTAGTFVQQTNHGGGSPILRGMIGPQNLMLVDGVRLNNSVYRTGPLQYLNLIDPLSVDRVEVLRGPGSVLYGSDAMGGVIQVLPLAPRPSGEDGLRSGQALVRMASANLERTGHGHVDVGAGGLAALGGFTYKSFDNLFGGGTVGEQPYSGYDNASWIGRLAYEIRNGPLAGWRLTAGYLGARIYDAGRTDKLVDKKSLQLYDNEDDLIYGRLNFRTRRLRTTGTLTLSFQRFFEGKDGFTMADDLTTRLKGTRDEVFANTVGVDLQMQARLLDNRFRLQAGGLFYNDWVNADRLSWADGQPWQQTEQTAYADGSTYANTGGFVVAEADLLRTPSAKILRLAGGYRLSGMGGGAPASEALPEVDFFHLGHVVYGSLQYLHDTRANVALSFSQGFRAPNLNEAVMLGDTGKFFHTPNPNLAPERSDTVELLLRGKLWRLTLEAAGFVSRLHDLIKREETSYDGQSEIDGKPVVWNVNGKQGQLWGTEGRLRFDVGYGLSLAGNLAFTWGEEQVPDGPDLPLTRIPPLFGQLGVRYDFRRGATLRGFVWTNVRGAAKQDRLSAEDEADVRIPDGGTPGWWTWNVRVGVVAYTRYRFAFNIDNLLDRTYKHHGSGIYGAGRNAMLSISATY